MKLSFKFSIFIFFLFYFSQSIAASSLSKSFKNINSYLEELAKDKLFSGSVLIAYKNDIILSKGYGYANFEKGIKNTSQTRFHIGSITKQFIAMLVLLLQQEGILSIHDKVSKYITHFPCGDELSIHHLLTHSSGIHNDYEDWIKIAASQPSDSVVNYLKAKESIFSPGEKGQYNNYNYILIVYIIESITKKSLVDLLRVKIFEPISMNDTSCIMSSEYDSNHAKGYLKSDGKRFQLATLYNCGEQNFSSTVLDLYLWGKALKTNWLFSQDITGSMWTPYSFIRGKKWGAYYGYGFFIDEMLGKRRIFHHGNLMGYMGTISIFPDDDVYIIILSNLQSFPRYETVKKISETFFGNSKAI